MLESFGDWLSEDNDLKLNTQVLDYKFGVIKVLMWFWSTKLFDNIKTWIL